MLIAAMFVAAGNSHAAGWVPRPGIEVSGSYGTVSRTSQDPNFDVLDRPYGGGWSVAATAEWTPAPTWTLVSGLRYLESAQSQRLTLSVSNGGSTVTGVIQLRDTWHWLAVPMRVKVTPWAMPLSLEVGPEVQVLLSARWHSQLREVNGMAPYAPATASPAIRWAPLAQIFEGVGTGDNDQDVTDLHRRVNLVVGGGVSYAWQHIVAHARCGFGLNDLRKSGAIASRTRAMEVGAGWQW
jgi:hypothetical protein